MIKLFVPKNKSRVKTNVRGFWRNEAGRTFYDYLDVKYLGFLYKKHLEALKIKYNQEAIAYCESKGLGIKLKIYYNKNKTEVFSKRIYKEVLRTNLKQEIKEALSLYGGITIYKEGGKYFKEIYYK